MKQPGAGNKPHLVFMRTAMPDLYDECWLRLDGQYRFQFTDPDGGMTLADWSRRLADAWPEVCMAYFQQTRTNLAGAELVEAGSKEAAALRHKLSKAVH
jgi:hypothetical protein